MGLIALTCQKCGGSLEVDEDSATYTCKYCQTVHEHDYSKGATATPHSLLTVAERAFAKGEYGKAMQFIEQGLSIDPHHKGLLSLEEKTQSQLDLITKPLSVQTEGEIQKVTNNSEAEQYYLEAQFILNELHANKKVYGSNSRLTGATPANVDLALQYIDRSLEHFPENPAYLNLKALLLGEGKGDKKAAAELLKKAASINPRDINIQYNLKALKSSSCFIATAAFGTPLSREVQVLRAWRDKTLMQTVWGKAFVKTYYLFSPPAAKFIAARPLAMIAARSMLRPLIQSISKKQSFAKPFNISKGGKYAKNRGAVQ